MGVGDGSNDGRPHQQEERLTYYALAITTTRANFSINTSGISKESEGRKIRKRSKKNCRPIQCQVFRGKITNCEKNSFGALALSGVGGKQNRERKLQKGNVMQKSPLRLKISMGKKKKLSLDSI